MMRAMGLEQFGPPEVMREIVLPRPVAKPTEVLVKVHSAGVNPIDWHTRRGAPTPAAQVLGHAPHVLGWDVSGVVEEVGDGEYLFEPGDEVFGMPWFPRPASAYAEFVTGPSRQFALKPPTLSHDEAAALPLAGLTAWQGLVDAGKISRGQRVLILGAGGGVGHLAVQIAKSFGTTVIATAREAKHEWLRSLGADTLIDYAHVAFEDIVDEVDLVLDLVGDSADRTTSRALRTIRRGGRLVLVAPGVPEDIVERSAARGITVSRPILVEPDGAALARLAALSVAGDLRVTVEHSLPLREAARAHRLGETNHSTGKIVLRVR